MEILTKLVLAVSLTFPIYKEDVQDPRKPEQLEVVSEAVATNATEQANRWPGTLEELIAVTLAIGYHETRYSLRIHAGDCKPWECDRGRARGLWQMHQSAVQNHDRDVWLALPGLDRASTNLAAQQAIWRIIRSRRSCGSLERRGGDWILMTVRHYAGRGCVGRLKGEEERVRTVKRVLGILTEAVRRERKS